MTSRPASFAALLGVAVFVAFTGHVIEQAALEERETWPDVANRVTLPSPDTASVEWLGYRELGASVTWCRGLVYYGGAGEDTADYRYLTQFIDNIIALDPWFKPVYRWAAYAVTFRERKATEDEYILSTKYLEMAALQYPDEYEYQWLAGLRYWLDLKPDSPEQRREYQEIAVEFIESAMQKRDAPEDLATLAATFRTKLGQRERAIADLKQQIMMATSDALKDKMLRHLGQLTQDESLIDELRAAAKVFVDDWYGEYSYLPATMYVLIGNKPSQVIHFDDLATERDLFGTELDNEAAN